jgi:hypothetical protein
VCTILGTTLLPKALNVHRRIPHASLISPLTARPSICALLAASRVEGRRDLPEGGVQNNHLLNPNDPSWSATCFYYLYSERPVGSLGHGVKSIITGLQQEHCNYHTNCPMIIILVLFPCAHHRHCLSWL